MKKLFLLILFVVFLAACSGDDDTDDATANEKKVVGDDVEDATELSYWTFAGQHIDLFEDSVTRWNEEFPDRPIKLVAENYPFDQMHNNLLLSLQSGKGAPDIVDIEVGRFANFLQGEPQLEPMNEYVEPVLAESVQSRFEIYAHDGNYYGLPTHVGATVMYYNTEIMDEAGVDIDAIQTWDDFVEAGKQVVENTDSVMWTVSPGDLQMDFWPMVSQQDSDMFDENGEVILDSQTHIDTLQFLKDLVYEHEIAQLTPGNQNHAEEFYGFMNDGGSASVLAPLWYMGRFLDNMPDLEGKMAIRPLPAWEEGGKRSAGMGGTGTVVTNQSEHTELAKEFLAYTKLSEEGNIALWTLLGFDPPRWGVWENEAVREDNKYYQYFDETIFDVLMEIKDEINDLNFTEHSPDLINEYNTNIGESVLRQQSMTPEEALEQSAETIRSSMDRD